MNNDKLQNILNKTTLPITEKIIMILSNHIDYGNEDGGLISRKQFGDIANEINVLYKNEFNKFLESVQL